jgi:hypothetical protein
MEGPLTASIVTPPIATDGDAPAVAVQPQDAKYFHWAILMNPEASPAGEFSHDGFAAHAEPFPAGPSAIKFHPGSCLQGIAIRRVPGGVNLAGVRLIVG